jgi:hypothetical protein
MPTSARWSCDLTEGALATQGHPEGLQVADAEAPDTKKATGTSEPVVDTNDVALDPTGSNGKVMRISAVLPSK